MALKVQKSLTTVVALVMAASPALAHPSSGSGGFGGGFAHPFSGWDHMAAMIVIGSWIGFLPKGQYVTAAMTMIAGLISGFLLGFSGIHLPFVEAGILVSILVFALLTMLAARMPALPAGILIGLFTLFHGHAHGAEAPGGAGTLYVGGFVAASLLLASLGCGAARVFDAVGRPMFARFMGAAIAALAVVLDLAATP